ncbi:U7 snRNA-associated Sm-like protein LSm11 [Mercenaria mercenaria]|uniref:U7 snRNA-associated Sm-like protein LSm11 n=1 Tax=Mercenaria mercenaria TaxID=6596 RepID=UPI00234EECEF|nr:U7 snRNA-associated Sm-like protein LSm11 [Mercenaria mercenaria]
MAAPIENEQKSPVSDEVPEFLNPLSPKFDPRRALYDSHTPIPVPDAKQFNNLAEFENYLQGKDAKTLQKKKAKPKEQLPGIIAVRAAAQAKEAVRKAAIMAKNAGPSERSKTQERRNRSTTVFTRMESYKKGPLSLLRKCVEERLRVIVVVRAAVAVRSRCRGYVIGFDKHFNMYVHNGAKLILTLVNTSFQKKIKHEEEGISQEKLLAEETDKLSVQSSDTRGRSHGRNTNSRHSDKRKDDKVFDLREKLKLSKVSDANRHSDSKAMSSETSSGRSSSKETVQKSSDSERSKSKGAKVSAKETCQRSRPRDSKSSWSSVDTSESRHSGMQEDARKLFSSDDSYNQGSRSKVKTEHSESPDEKQLESSEIKRSRDFKDHYKNYMSDSNIYVKRQHQRLQENSSKSDSETKLESSDRQKRLDKNLKKHFQPFWPLYKKWTETRCYAEYEILSRHVNQLFIRGDNVVSVSLADC